ncbi:MAG: hypothetical protein NVV73_10145 [Cellvibrionaceae bacterium]|nr:hypothetical protein [Cellvibrionaceae bacterium]
MMATAGRYIVKHVDIVEVIGAYAISKTKNKNRGEEKKPEKRMHAITPALHAETA